MTDNPTSLPVLQACSFSLWIMRSKGHVDQYAVPVNIIMGLSRKHSEHGNSQGQGQSHQKAASNRRTTVFEMPSP
ncbi:hypothetical protein U0070_007687, partial [Myodes glareolus]